MLTSEDLAEIQRLIREVVAQAPILTLGHARSFSPGDAGGSFSKVVGDRPEDTAVIPSKGRIQFRGKKIYEDPGGRTMEEEAGHREGIAQFKPFDDAYGELVGVEGIEVFPPLQPEYLAAVVNVIARAIEVLGTREKALRWMKAPVRSLGNQSPLSLLGQPEGVLRIDDALGRIEHGVW